MTRPLRQLASRVVSEERYRAARVAGYRLLHRPTIRLGGPGSAVCDRIEEWAATRPDTPCTQLLAPLPAEFRLPRTHEPPVPDEYARRTVGTHFARWMVPVPDAVLIGGGGLVVLPDGAFAAESAYGHETLVQRQEYLDATTRPLVKKPGNWFALLSLWTKDNYYHWFHDVLTRLHGVLELLPADTRFAVPASLRATHVESLRVLGISADRLVPFDGRDAWQLELLHFATPTMNSGNDRPEVDDWLRRTFREAYQVTAARPTRRIYLSRRDAPKRRVRNEEAVEAALRDRGFETWVAAGLDLRAQVTHFAEAEAVVGAHGAGLTNMLFAAPGLTVVDVIDPSMLHNAYLYWKMADALGHDYWYVHAESVPSAGRSDDMDMHVERLLATLDDAGLTA